MPKPGDSLENEFAALIRLQGLLQEEQAVLIKGAVDSLPDLIRAKGFVISEITILADGRHQSLVAAGLTASEDSMQSWIDSAASPAEKQTWSELLALAKSTKELNRLNGILINKHTQTNQQLMSLFQSKAGNNFYGPDGQSNIKTSARNFGAV
ncbi:MAG TPA: flagellar protein FlgN [Herbaspirillum sp.]|nr:flagellar protein FlgN [Herbaspirillum sp.]